MTSRLRRLSTAVTTLAVILPMAVAGCGGDEADPDDTKKISIMIPLLGTTAAAPAEDGVIQTAIEEFVGKDLDITWVPNSNYGDRTNVVLASDDIPEIMVVQGKTSAFIQSAQAGAFWNLTDKLASYPNLQAESETVQLNASIEGEIYGIYRRRDPMRASVVVRKDWLANLGLSMPETTDDLYAIAKAFTENDPDGNGEDDTYGLVIPKWPGVYATASPYDIIETWFGAPNHWGERDGEIVPGFDTEEFLEANRYVKKMIDEGLINADFATLDSAQWSNPFFNGEAGIIIDMSSRSSDLLKLFRTQDATTYGNYVDITGNLTGPDGVLYSYPTTGYNGFLAISKQSVTTEEELDDTLSVLNKLSSKEGQILLNNGIEGNNFTVQDGYAVSTSTEDAAIVTITNDVTSFAQLGTGSNGYLAYQSLPGGTIEREMYEKRLAIHASDLESAVSDPTQAVVSETQTEKGATLDQIIADARIKYLAGQIDEEGLKDEIARWYSEGGEQIVEEMNEGYAKLK